MTEPLLNVNDLSMRFGGLQALDNVSLSVDNRQIVSIIGPNGAGKTTVFNCLSGFYKPTGGEILLDQTPVHGLRGYKISRMGLVRTFQHVRLFDKMTAIENLLVAQHRFVNTGLLSGLLKTPAYRHQEQAAMDNAAYWLQEVGLLDAANREAGNLAYGQQRRLEIARCMVTRPRLLLLDEPAAGLNPKETRDLNQLILKIRDEHHVAILLIEHDMGLVMDISEQIIVLNQGCPLASGTPAEIIANPEVIKAYLGEQ